MRNAALFSVGGRAFSSSESARSISSVLNADITLMSLSIWLFTGSMRPGLPYPRTLHQYPDWRSR